MLYQLQPTSIVIRRLQPKKPAELSPEAAYKIIMIKQLTVQTEVLLSLNKRRLPRHRPLF